MIKFFLAMSLPDFFDLRSHSEFCKPRRERERNCDCDRGIFECLTSLSLAIFLAAV